MLLCRSCPSTKCLWYLSQETPPLSSVTSVSPPHIYTAELSPCPCPSPGVPMALPALVVSLSDLPWVFGFALMPFLVLGMTCRHLQPHFIVFCRVLPQSTPFPRHMQTSWQCFMSHSFWWVFFIISLFCPYLFICSLLVLQGAFFGAKIIFLFCVFTLFLTFCWLVFTLFLPFWFAWPMRIF